MSRNSPLIGKLLQGYKGAVKGKVIRVIGWDPEEKKFVTRTVAGVSTNRSVGRMTHSSLDNLQTFYRVVSRK